MCKYNPKNHLSYDSTLMNIVKITQIILVGICVVVFIILLCLYVMKSIGSVNPVRMELCISTDSTGAVSTQAQHLADSLIYEIKKQETILEDKYQYFIKQQSNTQDILAVGSLILGIIVSLIGFYGFSTMKSIEDKARKIGEESANEAFDKRLGELQEQKYKELLEDKFKPEIAKHIKESLTKFEGEKTSSIDNHKERITSLEQSVSSLSKKVKNVSEKEQEAAKSPYESSPMDEPDVFIPQGK